MWSNECKNADRMIICFMAGPARSITYLLIVVKYLRLCVPVACIIMRQGRGSEATEAVFCLQAKKPLPSGSYERRVPKIKNKIIFLYQGCLFNSTP